MYLLYAFIHADKVDLFQFQTEIIHRNSHLYKDTSIFNEIHPSLYRYSHLYTDTAIFVQIHPSLYRYSHLYTYIFSSRQPRCAWESTGGAILILLTKFKVDLVLLVLGHDDLIVTIVTGKVIFSSCVSILNTVCYKQTFVPNFLSVLSFTVQHGHS